MSIGSNGRNMATFNSRHISAMDAFDRLPKAMRQALANANHNWSAAQCYEATRTKRLGTRTTSAAVIERIKATDGTLAAEMYALMERGEKLP